MAEKDTKNSRAKIDANKRYNDKTYDRISIIVPKGDKEKISEYATKVGESVNAYINRAIAERISRE